MSLARCIYNCDDNSDCENECVSQFKGRTSNCPCEVSIMIQVIQVNILFQFLFQFLCHLNIIQENCPAGCPCESYDCDDVSPTVSPTTTSVVTTSTTTEPVAKKAVLMLSTRYNNVPMVIGYNGEFNFEIL